MQVIALAAYEKRVKKLVSSKEREEMESAIAANPEAYPIMTETGGCRKVRWARGNRGRSAGIRVIFYYFVRGEAVYLLAAYSKNEKENLTDAEKHELKKLVKDFESA